MRRTQQGFAGDAHEADVDTLFEQQALNATAITIIGTKQELCQQRNDPGNKSERNAVWVACGGVAIALMSMLWQLVEYIK